MKAFYKFSDTLIKVYKQDGDWQVKSNCEIQPETWSSIWPDNINGSLKRAIKSHCDINNVIFYDDTNFLTIIEG